MDGRGTSSQRSGVVLLSRDVVLASWLRYLCAPSVRVVSAASGYEAAAEILASPAEALVIDFRAMNAAHQRLLDTARGLGMQILGIGKVPGDLPANALSRVRLVSQADLPDALREILAAEGGAGAPAADAGGQGGGERSAGAAGTHGTRQDAASTMAGREEDEETRQDAASTIAETAERALELGGRRPRHVKLAPKHAPQEQGPQGPASAGPADGAPAQPGQASHATAPAPAPAGPAGPTAGTAAGHAAGMAAAGRRPHDTPEPSVLAADLLAEQVPPALADRPSYRAVPAAAAAAAAASAPAGDADADAGANAPTHAGGARADAGAEGSRPKQPSDLLTPEEVAALLESDL